MTITAAAHTQPLTGERADLLDALHKHRGLFRVTVHGLSDEQARYRGLKDWRLWWAIFVGIVLCIYGFFIWFRIQHPW